MQIQRAKEESMGGVSRERRIIGESAFAAANEMQRKNKEQRTSVDPPFQRSSTSSVIPPRPITAKSLTLELPTLDVNSSFLHGSFDTTDNNLSSREKSSRKNDNDEVIEDDFVVVGKSIINSDDVKSSVATANVVYATIDSLALKRATLPLRLLPIDVNSDPISNVDDDEQSFKMKPAGSGTTTTQSKCRDVRSNPRNFPSPQSATTADKLEDIGKSTPSNDVTLFEKVVLKKNDNQLDCEISESAPAYSTIDHCSGSSIVPLAASCELPEIGRVIGNDENSNDDRSLEWSRSGTFERVEKIALENEKSDGNREKRRSRSHDESSGNVITVDDCRTSKERVVTLTKKKTMKKFTKLSKKKIFACKRKTVNNGATTDRFKPDLTLTKNDLVHRVSDRGTAMAMNKRSHVSMIPNEDVKNRNCPNSSVKERKYLSRKELRYASISLPTNFVHLSSATSPKLLSPNAKAKEKLEIRENGEASPSLHAKSTVYLKIGEKSKSDGTIVRLSDVDATKRNDNENGGRFDEKVRFLQLEKSQGVPEVVKISENEDNDQDEFARPSLDKSVRDETVSSSSIYEAMSEFSVIHPPRSSSSSSSSLSTAGKIITNTSFLWGTTMTGRRMNAASTNSMVNDESTTVILEKGVTSDENGKITEHSIDVANSYDHEAYDDVGNWRVDACTAYPEQQDSDHYDDVGLPLTVGGSRSLSSSTGTVFEEISVYDDVLPTTTSRASLDVTILENGSQSGNKNGATPVFTVNLAQNNYSHRGINGIDENFLKSNESENDDEHHDYLSIGNDYSSPEEEEKEVRCNDRGKDRDEDPLLLLYDDIQLPCQDRVNSLYAGSSSAGSLLGSLIYIGKESEWEDLEEVTAVADPVLSSPMTINNNNNKSRASQNTDHSPSSSSNKKKIAQRRSRRVKRQKSKVSPRRNPSAGRSLTSCTEAVGTAKSVTAPTISVAVSLGTGSVLLVGSSDCSTLVNPEDSRRNFTPSSSIAVQRYTDGAGSVTSEKQQRGGEFPCENDQRLRTSQMRVLRSENLIDTQETSCYVLEDSDDSNYETLFSSFPSDEFSSGDDDNVVNDKEKEDATSGRNGDSGVDITSGIDSIVRMDEAPARPVPPPPRESSLTGTLGKQMKMLRRTWSITKGSLGRMRRRTSNSNIDNDSSNGINDGENRDGNREQRQNCSGTDGRNKYLSFKRHFRKSVTGLSTFYLEANESHNVLHNDADDADDDDDDDDKKLSRNNNRTKEAIYGNISDNCNNGYTNTTYRNSGSIDQSRNNSNVDHYSMLDEEPLYQFYVVAAAARVAFESDSEGYEEVEDPMPSPSTVNLARPGHRTLWCQTPQVINSPLLQSLTSDERKVQEAKFEILTSEASYLNSLRVLVDQFLNNHDLMHEVLSPAEREKLFGGVPSVLGASERLLAELETVWREDPMLHGLPELLLNYAQRSSSVYVAYCSNQVSIDTTLKELRNRKGSKFVDTLTRIESHTVCQSLSLHSFLMLPMQRVTRLPLLADAVLSRLSTDKKEERTRWEVVLSQFSRVVVECNEGARAAGRLAEMEQLNRQLEYSQKVPPILMRGRHLIRRGPVVRLLAKSEVDYKLTFGRKYHKSSLYLLLLSDHLLIARPKSITTNEETYTVIDSCKRSLVALEKITEPESPFAGRNAMILTLLENYSGRHVEYILTCDNATERERWLDAISPPKPSLVGETLYETWDCPQVMALYLYAAAQPDELTLQPGDVINVLRKMTDGWYLGEKLLGGEQGWFPGNYAKEVSSEHVRARNLRQRHRLLALSASVLQQRAKQMSR